MASGYHIESFMHGAPSGGHYWSFSFEKWKHKKVFNLRSGTITYHLVQFI